jgi:hypothetical protein
MPPGPPRCGVCGRITAFCTCRPSTSAYEFWHNAFWKYGPPGGPIS